MNFKLAIIKATAILLPTYAVAFATEKMVYTMPMLAAVTIFVTALDFDSTFKKKDEDPVMSEESTMTEDSMVQKEVDIEGE
tara:strand:- start:247 stop:489 length:243 start_codon:yes stop_codon:yes gene_type:complete